MHCLITVVYIKTPLSVLPTEGQAEGVQVTVSVSSADCAQLGRTGYATMEAKSNPKACVTAVGQYSPAKQLRKVG